VFAHLQGYLQEKGKFPKPITEYATQQMTDKQDVIYEMEDSRPSIAHKIS
jgi:hypothetical protein